MGCAGTGRGCRLFIFNARWRWWFFRHRRSLLLVLKIAGVIALMLCAKGTFSPAPVEDSFRVVFKDGYAIPEYRAVTRQPSPADLERRNRSALFSRIVMNTVKHIRGKNREIIVCLFPRLDLKYDSNQFAFYDMPPLKCSGKRMFFVHNGKFVLNRSLIHDPSIIESCLFYSVQNYDDDFYFYSKPVIREVWPFENVKVEHDFVRIQCTLKGSQDKKALMPAKAKSVQTKAKVGFMNFFFGKNQEGNEFYDEHDPKTSEKKNAAQDEDEEMPKLRRKKETERWREDKQQLGDKLTDSEYLDDLYYWNSEDGDYYDKFYPNLNSASENDEFDQFSVQISPKPEVFQRISNIISTLGRCPTTPNVLMLAVNSVSHLSFQRTMPQTYEYLKRDLGAVMLQNYNIVGELLKDQLIPLLTGISESELPDVQATKYNAQLMDVYPFIWKNFQQRGYATLYGEDEPSKNVFNTGFYGFERPPTDHYMRPFWQALWGSKLQQNSPRFCTGDIANHRYMLNYVEDFFVTYHNVSRFAFAFFRELSYSNANPLQYLDGDMMNFLQRLEQKKFLDNTVVVIFSDRGANANSMHNTVLSKLEERLPMMSFVFPWSFRQRYAQAYANLVTNARRLTTPYDVHETLLDILDMGRAHAPLPGHNASEMTTLFEEVPLNRSCKDVGISTYLCTCLNYVVVDPGEEFVKAAADELLRYMNSRTDMIRVKCTQLGLQQIHNAHLLVPPWRVLKYTHSGGKILRWPVYNSPFDLRVAHLKIHVRTSPCNVLYEANIIADFRNYSSYQYHVVAKDVRGLGMQRLQYRCIQYSFPSLKTYCCCRNSLRP